MNLFILDENPKLAAQQHVDKHVVKMILETAQLLSTAHHVLKSEIAPFVYKKTHTNHPCAIWVRECSANYLWTLSLFEELLKEYTFRYGKEHSSVKLVHYLRQLPKGIKLSNTMTPFAQAMPDTYKHKDAVIAYRMYYKYDKVHLHAWTKRMNPKWLDNNDWLTVRELRTQ